MQLTITLSDEEYAELQRKASEDRRTPEQMAEWLVVKGVVPVPSHGVLTWTFRPYTYPPSDGTSWPGLTTVLC